jgi:hypothetical protein
MADIQIMAGAYQRRQEWRANIQAAAIARIIFGARPAAPAVAGTRTDAPRPPAAHEPYMRGSNGKRYEKVNPFEMMGLINGS